MAYISAARWSKSSTQSSCLFSYTKAFPSLTSVAAGILFFSADVRPPVRSWKNLANQRRERPPLQLSEFSSYSHHRDGNNTSVHLPDVEDGLRALHMGQDELVKSMLSMVEVGG